MITFENIKTGEKVNFTADQDPEARQAHMAAYLNSSNLHANSSKGQDFGWRLAPEIVAEMDRMRTDAQVMGAISQRIGISFTDIRDFHLLSYIAEQDFMKEATTRKREQQEAIHEKEYNTRLAALRDGNTPVSEETDSAKETVSAKIPPVKPTNQEK